MHEYAKAFSVHPALKKIVAFSMIVYFFAFHSAALLTFHHTKNENRLHILHFCIKIKTTFSSTYLEGLIEEQAEVGEYHPKLLPAHAVLELA